MAKAQARRATATKAVKDGDAKVIEDKPEVNRKRGRPKTSDPVSKKPKLEIENLIKERTNRNSAEGKVLTLGQGDTGQLGLGEDIMERSKPALVKSIEQGVKVVVAGGMHTVALRKDGVVLTFGCNDEGALGRAIDDDEEGFTPGEVKLPVEVVQISAGDSHCAALGVNGAVYYWGTFRDSSGSFGLTPDGLIQKMPIPLAGNLKVAKISSGADHIALLTTEGQLYTLGCAEQGQLGRVGERFTARGGRRGLDLLLKPDQVHSKNRRAVFKDVWAGSYDTLALTMDNEVYACGLNNYNQLGIDKGMVFHTLVKSKGLSDACKAGWTSIAFGQHHALCLDDKGQVFSIGRAEYGRLGLGESDTTDGKGDAKTPTLIPKLKGKKCVEIGCGTAVSFAVADDGSCYSWGMCTNEQLGHAESDKDAWEPVQMAGKQLETRKVVGISGGGQHTVLLAKE